MKVIFCLPGYNRKPIGGYKMVYEYANRLSENGHDVSIAFVVNKVFRKYKLPRVLRFLIGKMFVRIFPRWFRLNKSIKKIAVWEICDKEIPCGDIIFATSIATAEPVKNLGKNKGQKFYLIQDYENWRHSNDYVNSSYRFGMKNIVVANWLKDVVDCHSKNASILIPNAIDTETFNINLSPEKRNPYTIAALYHVGEYKGSQYTLEVLKILKEKYPNLKAHLFGNPKRPNDLPSWIDYTQQASKEQVIDIYNNASIFICTSIEEGFGLTGAESMACGCAFVSTAYKGVHEYAINKVNSLLSPIREVNLLVENIEMLFSDNQLRIDLAYKGHADIEKLSWENTFSKFERVLKDSVN